MACDTASEPAAPGGLPASPGAWMQIRGLTKHFGGELALDGVDLDVELGKVHGLVGANGAGKSTLIRCLAGVTVADQGNVTIAGQELHRGSPPASERAGLAFIHQELNLIPQFSALQNMLLGAPKKARFGLIDWRRSGVGARAAAERVGFRFPLDTRVADLSVADRWLVMIGKALTRDAAMIAMDEPTASLSGPESEQLFSIVRDLAAQGVAILYVSHRLDEVLSLCDRITVLRDGRAVAEADRGTLDKRGLVQAIVGHEVRTVRDADRCATDRSQAPLFSVRNVTWKDRVRNVSFDLYRGEVLGLGGLVGAGRTELAHLAAGVTRPDAGRFELEGEPLRLSGEADGVAAGIALVPEERRSQGLMLQQSIGFNINVATLRQLRVVPGLPFVSARKARQQADRLIGELGIKAPSALAKIAGLSGGNQQKALIARWLPAGMRLLLLDEPSRGVDVGAREDIHAAIRALARAGVGILVISSEVEELTLLADRVLVMREGRIAGELAGSEISETAIIELSYHDAQDNGDQA